MSKETRPVAPDPRPGWVRDAQGRPLQVPSGWALLPPGDAALTRRVKQDGPHWVVQERRGRRTVSRGVWAPSGRIEALRASLEAERATPAYQRRLVAGRERRAAEHVDYVRDFRAAVVEWLAFDPRHAELAAVLAERVTEHATPVGSGTVARTQRIPLQERVAAAVIAWLRHQTTGYDQMEIPREKGRRREVRRRLAKRSRKLLGRYRRGEPVDPEACPLQRALAVDRANPGPRPASAKAPRALGVPSSRPQTSLWQTPLRRAGS